MGSIPPEERAPGLDWLNAWNPREEMSGLREDLAETPDGGGDHPRLSDAQLARFNEVGQRRPVVRGDVLYRPGDEAYDFYIVVPGAVAVVSYVGAAGRRVVRVYGELRFLGALDLLRHQRVVQAAVVIHPGVVLRVPVERLRSLLAREDELRDLVVRAYMRREAIGRHLVTDIFILANPDDPRTRPTQARAGSQGLDTQIDDATAPGALDRLGPSVKDLPVVLTPDGTLLRAPAVNELEGTRSTPSEGSGHNG
ncbi:MAG: cyclic nucleotide-binding domain-containing protein [Propionibacteriaceae bacterium]|nr:cyclic nucleotide-binding domain-containing protein [Propionibacteriaceae bacterium]